MAETSADPGNASTTVNLAHITSGLTLQDGIWRSPRPSNVSYPEADADLLAAVEDNSFWFNHRNRIIIETLRAHPPAGPLFDIGAGGGVVSAALSRAGFQTVVVEPGTQAVKIAQRRGVEHIIHATFDDAGFQPGSLPAVGLFDVLEHIEDDAGVLANLNTAMATNGMLYITVPAYQWLWSDEDTRGGHFRRHTIGTLSRLIRENGFSIRFASYFFSLLPAPIWLFRTLPHLLGKRTEISANRLQQQHGGSPETGTRLATSLFNWERAVVRRGGKIPFGSSIILVAQVAI